MICIARIFGAPDTVPAGKHARSRSNGVTPSRSSPATSETRCVMCEKRSGSRKRSTRTVPGLAHAREVVAPEVDEHDVLGAVLLGAEQRLRVAVARRDRAGDRVQLGVPALAFDDRLRRGADQREPVELEQEEVRRRVDPAQRAIELERGRGRRPLGALRDDDLERVARADVVLRATHAPLVLRLVREAAERAARDPSPRGTGGCGASSASASP